jgi:hypothetical protein
MTTTAEILSRNVRRRAQKKRRSVLAGQAQALKAAALLKSGQAMPSQTGHHTDAELTPLQRAQQMRAMHEQQQARQSEYAGLAALLETPDEVREFLAIITLDEDIDLVAVCAEIPTRPGWFEHRPNLQEYLPEELQRAIALRKTGKAEAHAQKLAQIARGD